MDDDKAPCLRKGVIRYLSCDINPIELIEDHARWSIEDLGSVIISGHRVQSGNEKGFDRALQGATEGAPSPISVYVCVRVYVCVCV